MEASIIVHIPSLFPSLSLSDCQKGSTADSTMDTEEEEGEEEEGLESGW